MAELVPFDTPTVNPQSIALLNRAPYLGVSEFQKAPHALDLSNLVPAGLNVEQQVSLAAIISRTSSWADQICFPNGTGGTLSASTDVDAGRVRILDGQLVLVCRFKPILAVTAVSVGTSPSTVAPISAATAADIEIDDRVLRVPYTQCDGTRSLGRRGNPYAVWSVIDGYPHSVLTQALSASATTVHVGSTLGMFPGTTLTIYDDEWTETVTVLAVTNATTFTTTAGCAYAHALPEAPDTVGVSALPPSAKEAMIILTAARIKARGDNALTIHDISTADPSMASMSSSGATRRDMDVAREILAPFTVRAGNR